MASARRDAAHRARPPPAACSRASSRATSCVCDQFVDRTYAREQTFYDGPRVVHISTADPYCPELREHSIDVGRELGITVHERGTVVVIQGPRFSTRAESQWFSQQGWEVINMTQYPEVVLARELEMCYVNISLITDYDVGLEGEAGIAPVTVAEVVRVFNENNERVKDAHPTTSPAHPRARAMPAPCARPRHHQRSQRWSSMTMSRVWCVGSIGAGHARDARSARPRTCSAARRRTSRWPPACYTGSSSSPSSATTSRASISTCCARKGIDLPACSASPRQDVPLGGPLRLRPERRAHARHPAQRVRRLPPEAAATSYREAEYVFLANIDPALQLEVLDQVRSAAVAALDSMNFWIDEQARDELTEAMSQVDVVLLNDGEVREYAGTYNLFDGRAAITRARAAGGGDRRRASTARC